MLLCRTLDSVHKRTRKYAGWNSVKKFREHVLYHLQSKSHPAKVKMGEIEKGLSDCETKLDTAISAFQVSELRLKFELSLTVEIAEQLIEHRTYPAGHIRYHPKQ